MKLKRYNIANMSGIIATMSGIIVTMSGIIANMSGIIANMSGMAYDTIDNLITSFRKSGISPFDLPKYLSRKIT